MAVMHAAASEVVHRHWWVAMGLNRRLAGASARKAPQKPGHPDLPAPVHRRLRLAQPAATLLNRQTLCQSEQYVRDIDRVSGEQSGIGAPLDSADEDLSHGRRCEFLGAGVEILEGSREHHPG